MWPWVFDLLAYHMARKPTVPSDLNSETWSLPTIAKHTDYGAEGTIGLAKAILREGVQSDEPDIIDVLKAMPRELKDPYTPVQPDTTPPDDAPPTSRDEAGADGGTGTGTDKERDEDTEEDQPLGKKGKTRANKERPDYSDQGAGTSKGGPSRKRQSTIPPSARRVTVHQEHWTDCHRPKTMGHVAGPGQDPILTGTYSCRATTNCHCGRRNSYNADDRQQIHTED